MGSVYFFITQHSLWFLHISLDSPYMFYDFNNARGFSKEYYMGLFLFLDSKIYANGIHLLSL